MMAAANPDKKTAFKKGFPKEIINGGNVDHKYLCAVCDLVLRNPIQSFCGHRFCRACIENLLKTAKENQQITCPSCAKEESENEYSNLQNTFPDNAIKREFTSMKTKCINDGCSWEGPFKSYIDHETTCDYQLFDCECGKQIPKHTFEEHKQDLCENRILYCPYCNASVMAKNMEAHEGECPMVPMKCQGCGKEGLTRSQLQKHQDLETGDCEARAKICPLQCGKTVESDLKTHLSEAPGDHIMVLTDIVKKMDKKMKHVMGDDGVTVADSVPTAPLTNSSDFERLYRKVTDLEHRMSISQSGKAQKDDKTPADGSSGGAAAVVAEYRSLERGEPDGGDIAHKIKVTDTKVVQFEDALSVLTQQLDSFRAEADTLHEMNRELKGILETQDRKMKSLEKSIQLKDLSLAEADLKIQALEQTSYDGIMTWKITDFARKRQDAINGRMSSIYSPPFYTSKTGHKMCARLYLNGDGMGKGTHLSLFFVVMKGTYDALLKWPFRQKVTLMLLDQNQHDHVVEAFRPDPNSSSFRRPTSDMNIASGCPLFCQLTQIDQTIPAYLKDDTMFIKIIVDPADL